MEENKRSKGLPFSSVLAIALLVVIFYWFLSGDMYRFYASAVFLFYSWTKVMWVSVIMLGVFQTLLMIPFRVIRLLDFKNIRDFQEDVSEKGDIDAQGSYLKRQFRQGSWTFTFYLLDFVVQLTTYMTIGRLFLTDFYSKPLDPKAIYSFVTYPDYPILERFFKIPYPLVTKTMDFGMESVIYMWLIILLAELTISLVVSLVKRFGKVKKEEKTVEKKNSPLSAKYMLVYGAFLYFVSFVLIRSFPVGWKVGIFSGDVAFQNNTFNTVTALATFLTLMYFGVNDILRKAKMARSMGIPESTVSRVQTTLFKDSLSNATLVGAGAYFITNHIPCAFELSIFTLEVISLFSPLTLDRWILKMVPKKQKVTQDRKEKEKEEVGVVFK